MGKSTYTMGVIASVHEYAMWGVSFATLVCTY